MTPMPGSTAAADHMAITSWRDRSNAAIAARDPAAAVAYLAAYSIVLASTGEQVRGTAEMRDIFDRMFAETGFEGLTRDMTDLSIDGPRAVEEGGWVARWSGRSASGRYMSRWRKTPDGWLADAELYVSLSTQG